MSKKRDNANRLTIEASTAGEIIITQTGPEKGRRDVIVISDFGAFARALLMVRAEERVK